MKPFTRTAKPCKATLGLISGIDIPCQKAAKHDGPHEHHSEKADADWRDLPGGGVAPGTVSIR